MSKSKSNIIKITNENRVSIKNQFRRVYQARYVALKSKEVMPQRIGYISFRSSWSKMKAKKTFENIWGMGYSCKSRSSCSSRFRDPTCNSTHEKAKNWSTKAKQIVKEATDITQASKIQREKILESLVDLQRITGYEELNEEKILVSIMYAEEILHSADENHINDQGNHLFNARKAVMCVNFYYASVSILREI